MRDVAKKVRRGEKEQGTKQHQWYKWKKKNSFLLVIQRLAVINPPSRGLSRSITRGGGHWPHVHDAGALSQAVGRQMGQSEGRQPADPEALVLPGQHVVSQVDFLVNHGELDLRVLTRYHLRRRGEGEKDWMCDDLHIWTFALELEAVS